MTAQAGLIGFDTEEYEAQERAWEIEKHDRELLECLALTSPTFERAHEVLGKADYQEYVNDVLREDAENSRSTHTNLSQNERAEILYRAMKTHPHGENFAHAWVVDQIGSKNISQVVSITRAMLKERNHIILFGKAQGRYRMLK